ncbi:MAG: PAS domain S-box protein [Anaerolineae bacterium]|nr:PAS domain S-box protein [Anaerolineae bacterium]
MEKRLRALIVEDSEDDSLLVLRELRKGGYTVTYERVFSADALQRALDNDWDVVISDYSMPGFNALEALGILREREPDLPFILVSGTVGEDAAVTAMRAGAQDFFTKSKLGRLVPAVEREVRDSFERRRRRWAEQQLRQSEDRFAKVFHASPIAICVTSLEEYEDAGRLGSILDVNESFLGMMGYHRAEIIGHSMQELEMWLTPVKQVETVRSLRAQGTVHDVECELRTHSGQILYCLISMEQINLGNQLCVLSMINDITQRKHTEQALAASERFAHSTVDALSAQIVILDEDGTILSANQAWRDFVTHDSRYQLLHMDVGQNYLDVYERIEGGAAKVAHIIADGVRAVIRGDIEDVFMQEFLYEIGNDRQWFMVRVTRFPGEGPVRVVVAHENITSLKLAEIELQSLYNATSFLFKADSLLNLGHQIAQAVVEEFGQADCGIMMVDRAGNKMLRLARAGKYTANPTTVLFLDRPGLVTEAVRTGKVIYAADVINHPLYIPSESRTRSELVIPLRTTDGIIGVMDLQSVEIDAFSEREQRVILAFAERATSAIQTMQLYEQINQHAAELEWRVTKRTAELQAAKEHVEAILSNSNDAIVLLDPSGLINQTNPAFNALFELEAGVDYKKPITDYIDPGSTAAFLKAVGDVLQAKQSMRVEVVFLHVDGSRFDTDVALAPLMNEENSPVSVICSLRDITDRKEVEESLRQALAQQQELNELKSRFASMVSHEFRNPLAAIQTLATLLLRYDDRLPQEKKLARLESIIIEVKRLTELLDDILLISKGEAVGLELRPEPVDLTRFVQNMVEEFKLISETHQIECRMQVPERELLLDTHLFRQILANLLSNAIKYSDTGSLVEVDLVYEGAHLKLKVSDHGIGIPEEDQARLFQNFHRASNVGSVQGTGLGLAIVQQAVEAHHGTISFESAVGEGTTFMVSIPMQRSA